MGIKAREYTINLPHRCYSRLIMIAGAKIDLKPQIGTITDYLLRTSAEIHVYMA